MTVVTGGIAPRFENNQSSRMKNPAAGFQKEIPMENILDYPKKTLENWLEENGIKPYRARQIFKWLYIRNADNFDQMTDISRELRGKLNTHFVLPRLSLETTEISSDGTEKFLFRLADGVYIESVLIPEKDHYTLCISSQAGCAMGCRFCLTAMGGFIRNLSSAEITSQIRDIKQYLAAKKEAAPLSNIVFMGMGEPLANYDAVLASLDTITDTDFGLKFSPRRVTVSTAGIVPNIRKLGTDTRANLAVSLNATDDTTRSMLMPVNRKYPLKDLLMACRTFPMKPRNKITFEYILIADINDSDKDALQLCRMLAPIRSKVNLIPFNAHDASAFKRPSEAKVSRFLQILLDKQMTAIVRKSKGQDISAACGQLRANQRPPAHQIMRCLNSAAGGVTT